MRISFSSINEFKLLMQSSLPSKFGDSVWIFRLTTITVGSRGYSSNWRYKQQLQKLLVKWFMANTSCTYKTVRKLARRTAVRKGRGTNVGAIDLQFKELKGVGTKPTVVSALQKAQLDMVRLTPIRVPLQNISSFCITSLGTRFRTMFRTKWQEKLEIICSKKWSKLRV